MRSALVLLFSFLFADGALLAQTHEQRARIDYETARLALQQNKPDVALEKLERVIIALGKQPELLVLAADAAFQAGRVSRARDLVAEAFASSDAEFESSESFRRLIDLAARVELAMPDLTAKERGYWNDPVS